MKDILKNYRRRLLNLSSSNRALVLLRLSKELHLDVQELDFLDNQPAFNIIQKIISKKKVTLCPYADSRYAPVTPISRRLRTIRRKAEMIFEERGSKELFVGWPFVHGAFPDGTVVRSPLLFFPVKLQVNPAQDWELLPDETQQAQFNQSFLLAYAHYMGVPLAEQLTELDLVMLPADALSFRTAVYELLKEHQLTIQAGREIFADKLNIFRDYKKADFEERVQPGQLHLRQEAVLGVYPQAASYLLADYDALLEQNSLQHMEDLFMPSGENKSNAAMQAQHTFTVFDIDASQEAALQEVKTGKSLVVQGPPGTGKSQLICNLVSDFTARGKKVLVVSQKRAALDVVHQRLASKGLASFAALVHDINTDRRSIYNQLAQQIEQVEEYRSQKMALNSIYTDRVFLEISRGINRCIQKLNSFKQALFDTSRCGWSAKELYLQSNLSQPHISFGLTYYKSFTAATVPDFLPRLKQYLQQALVFERDDFVWKQRYSMKDWGWPERQQLENMLAELPKLYGGQQQAIEKLSGYSFSLEQLPQYVERLQTVSKTQEVLSSQEVSKTIQPLLRKQVKVSILTQQVKELKQLYLSATLPDKKIAARDVDEVRDTIADYCDRKGKAFRRAIWWLLLPQKKILKQALSLYNWELSKETVAQLQQRLQFRQHAEELMQVINEGMNYHLNIMLEPEEVLRQVQVIEQSIVAYKLLRQLHKAKFLNLKLLYKLSVSLPAYLEQLNLSIKSLDHGYQEWLQWLPEAQVKQLIAQPGYGKELAQVLQEHFEVLVAYDRLTAGFSGAEREVATLLMSRDLNTVDAGIQLFLNSLYLAWLHDLEQQCPELRMPSNGELKQLEGELQRLLDEKNKLSQEIVLSKLREQTYHHMEYNRLGNAVTYRRLGAQVAKKRNLYPVRKLFSTFAGEILDLVPCWLASPETVSAVMPLQPVFDLIIFDEASQCFAETGIPAMLRGRQVLVAGDEQQLKPSDLYRARWTSEDEGEVEELSAESLLQLCSIYLPQTMLTQHYRSRYPELIDFSNKHFYRNRLELIPDRLEVNAGVPAIEFVKVQGVWQHNTNIPEAEAVVKLVLNMLEVGQKETGVITFNYNQQALVQDLLEDMARQNGVSIPASVLVKNIENIQGDEKELIILSVGYAPDEQGKMAMQFGSLNQSGGENRLNVAITRARQKVIVVSSVLPEQLQVEHALHQGPKLLKAYLQYACEVSKSCFTYSPKANALPAVTSLLKDKLQELVEELGQELPFADLTFKKGQKYRGVVLTDDNLYYSHVSARHSHADVPLLLQSRHWNNLKVYSREFWAAPEQVLERLHKWEEKQNPLPFSNTPTP
ncbi:AAA domain-containing protein [Pontibacter silvestris]|uniref:AAA domain-containing protein n=1 Tax=Pontibacter silvestris TaxID=2305183 RepID=A0ABW4WTV2_9BACT|nr:AAA domain-containing protein [Pontibacter silvestris]MCC9137288.1 AAA domain-containing protein [Pontibacter silvestris]